MAEPRRIFAPPGCFGDGALELEGERLRHLRSVLRLGPGDEISATDGAGAEYRVRIEQLGRDRGRARILERTEPARESPLELVLAQALPKGERFSTVLEKAVELGVSALLPLLSERTVSAGGGAAPARWQRIVEAALAQSGRTRLPALRPLRTFEELVAAPGRPAVNILLWEHAEAGLDEFVVGRAVPPRSVLVAIGPEGSWSSREVQLAREAGFAVLRFGPRILRTDTAGIAALAVLQSRWGDLG